MIKKRNRTEEVLNLYISGFHRYSLNDPVHISYASENLCRMLGVSAKELEDAGQDCYALFIHPEDRERYRMNLIELRDTGRAIVQEYRLLSKDGALIHVRDEMNVQREDGVLTGYSVLHDIGITSHGNGTLSPDENMPCAFLRYTCEKQPRITYMNRRMLELLRFPDLSYGELDYLEMYKSNIFLLIPMEERRRFSKYLDTVFTAGSPISGEMTLLRFDGTRAKVLGWVVKTINEQGEEEFQSVCMDITEQYRKRTNTEEKRYLNALADVYDKIFEFNIFSNTVKCLHCGENSYFRNFRDVAMQSDDALEKWLLTDVEKDYRDAVGKFFRDLCQGKLYTTDSRPPQITYFARATDGTIKQYTGVVIKVDESVSFYCCRELKNTGDTQALKTENDHLKEGMRDLVLRFSDGLAAFEISPEGGVKPLYAGENVCEFFGYTQEEWLVLTQRFTPWESFVAYSDEVYDKFAALLRDGEAEYIYYDHKTETERRIKAICSSKESDGCTPRYVMLYPMGNGQPREKLTLPERRVVSIRTFGYFDVFVGDKPIVFRNKKAKELLALLVDRSGGYITSEEAISFLWEDEPVSPLTLARYRKVALRLKNTLEEYGIPYVVEAVDGKRRIVRERVQCDLYNYLSGDEKYAHLFKGSYLTNYSWAETTLGELTYREKGAVSDGQLQA